MPTTYLTINDFTTQVFINTKVKRVDIMTLQQAPSTRQGMPVFNVSMLEFQDTEVIITEVEAGIARSSMIYLAKLIADVDLSNEPKDVLTNQQATKLVTRWINGLLGYGDWYCLPDDALMSPSFQWLTVKFPLNAISYKQDALNALEVFQTTSISTLAIARTAGASNLFDNVYINTHIEDDDSIDIYFHARVDVTSSANYLVLDYSDYHNMDNWLFTDDEIDYTNLQLHDNSTWSASPSHHKVAWQLPDKFEFQGVESVVADLGYLAGIRESASINPSLDATETESFRETSNTSTVLFVESMKKDYSQKLQSLQQTMEVTSIVADSFADKPDIGDGLPLINELHYQAVYDDHGTGSQGFWISPELWMINYTKQLEGEYIDFNDFIVDISFIVNDVPLTIIDVSVYDDETNTIWVTTEEFTDLGEGQMIVNFKTKVPSNIDFLKDAVIQAIPDYVEPTYEVEQLTKESVGPMEYQVVPRVNQQGTTTQTGLDEYWQMKYTFNKDLGVDKTAFKYMIDNSVLRLKLTYPNNVVKFQGCRLDIETKILFKLGTTTVLTAYVQQGNLQIFLNGVEATYASYNNNYAPGLNNSDFWDDMENGYTVDFKTTVDLSTIDYDNIELYMFGYTTTTYAWNATVSNWASVEAFNAFSNVDIDPEIVHIMPDGVSLTLTDLGHPFNAFRGKKFAYLVHGFQWPSPLMDLVAKLSSEYSNQEFNSTIYDIDNNIFNTLEDDINNLQVKALKLDLLTQIPSYMDKEGKVDTSLMNNMIEARLSEIYSADDSNLLAAKTDILDTIFPFVTGSFNPDTFNLNRLLQQYFANEAANQDQYVDESLDPLNPNAISSFAISDLSMSTIFVDQLLPDFDFDISFDSFGEFFASAKTSLVNLGKSLADGFNDITSYVSNFVNDKFSLLTDIKTVNQYGLEVLAIPILVDTIEIDKVLEIGKVYYFESLNMVFEIVPGAVYTTSTDVTYSVYQRVNVKDATIVSDGVLIRSIFKTVSAINWWNGLLGDPYVDLDDDTLVQSMVDSVYSFSMSMNNNIDDKRTQIDKIYSGADFVDAITSYPRDLIEDHLKWYIESDFFDLDVVALNDFLPLAFSIDTDEDRVKGLNKIVLITAAVVIGTVISIKSLKLYKTVVSNRRAFQIKKLSGTLSPSEAASYLKKQRRIKKVKALLGFNIKDDSDDISDEISYIQRLIK
jgi:hypothetical protein